MSGLGAKNPLTEDVLQSIQTEIIILTGSEDKMAAINHSRQVSHLLTNSKFHEIESAMHALQQVDLEKLTLFII